MCRTDKRSSNVGKNEYSREERLFFRPAKGGTIIQGFIIQR